MRVTDKTENAGLACNVSELYLGCSYFELLWGHGLCRLMFCMAFPQSLQGNTKIIS